MSNIECIEYKSHQSGALQGYANLRVPRMGIELFGCGVFMKDGKRWLSMPSREYNDPDTGKKEYISIMRFIQKEHSGMFCKSALQAVDEWCAQNVKQESPQNSNQPNDGAPF